jgi:hypothetical protein
MRMTSLVVPVLAALLAAPAASGADQENRHKRWVKEYTGTETCLKCHEEEAEAFFHSQHYQWRGETPAVVNADGERLGKLTMINDFCTNPGGPQWIGKVTNDDGKVLAKGCSTCHAGLGLLPAETPSREQLENIDCLICHANGYRRDLYATEDGGWEWRPILWKNAEGMNSVAQRITVPTRTMCLRCHSASGGGPNFKRGDIEYTLKEPDRSFDVHMAANGKDMWCVDCHAGDAHRVKGRGVDLAATDSPGHDLSCSGSCHGETPHGIPALDNHADRVYCTTCHIPVFAKDEPTDMRRDWSTVTWSEEKGKYTYDVTLRQNVEPVYAWYNGTSYNQIPGQPVRRDENGAVTMVLPEGNRSDPSARIYAFKLHQGVLPLLKGKDWIMPVATEELYHHGDPDRAVRDAARAFYGLDDVDYEWTDTVRYMGIFHEVPPAEDALQCLDCHSPDGRMDWQALGYDGDPLANPRSAAATDFVR